MSKLTLAMARITVEAGAENATFDITTDGVVSVEQNGRPVAAVCLEPSAPLDVDAFQLRFRLHVKAPQRAHGRASTERRNRT